MSKGGFPEFREAFGDRESSDRYDIVNEYGYLGRYQFGKLRLIDLGLMNRAGWLYGLDEDKFLKNAALQNAAFVAHVADHLRNIDRRYQTKYGMLIEGIAATPSGLVAAAHLVGLGGVNKMIRTGIAPQDGNGVKATEYLDLFANYDLPRDMPLTIPRSVIF